MAFLSTEQLEHFQQEGFLVVEQFLAPERDLDPILTEYAGVLDRLAEELLACGAIASLHRDLPFSERLVQIYAESGKVHAQYFDFSLPQDGITEATPFWTGPAVFNTIRSPEILDAIESIIGSEILSNPVQHVRMKPPEHLTPIDPVTGRIQLGATPWHQDNGVLLEDADESDIITVWFPLTDATIENGCLAVVPFSHAEGLLPHCPANAKNASGFGVHIKEHLFNSEGSIPLPMKRGDALFMTKRTIHSSLPNLSNDVRFSFDLRYNPTGQPTGRGMFPGFVVRSRANPQTELTDATAWTQLWLEARRAIAAGDQPQFNRWDPFSPACA
jgi:hypothetical protein